MFHSLAALGSWFSHEGGIPNLTGEKLAMVLLVAMVIGVAVVFYYQRAMNQLFTIVGVVNLVAGAGLVYRYRGEIGSLTGAVLIIAGILLLFGAIGIGILKGMAEARER